jgi:hypothetical protein
MPPSWNHLGPNSRELLLNRRSDDAWWYVYKGIEAGSGSGSPIEDGTARAFLQLRGDDEYAAVQVLGLYDEAGYCASCRVAYCRRHWDPSMGAGTCPEGHFKSLDPHWHPYDD